MNPFSVYNISHGVTTIVLKDPVGVWKKTIRNDGIQYVSPNIRFTNRSVDSVSLSGKEWQDSVKFCYLFDKFNGKLKTVNMETKSGNVEIEIGDRYVPKSVRLLAGNTIDGFSHLEITAQVDCLGGLDNVKVLDPNQQKIVNYKDGSFRTEFLKDTLSLFIEQFNESNPYNIRAIFSS